MLLDYMILSSNPQFDEHRRASTSTPSIREGARFVVTSSHVSLKEGAKTPSCHVSASTLRHQGQGKFIIIVGPNLAAGRTAIVCQLKFVCHSTETVFVKDLTLLWVDLLEFRGVSV